MKFFKWFWGKKKDDEVFLSDILGNMSMHKKKKWTLRAVHFAEKNLFQRLQTGRWVVTSF